MLVTGTFVSRWNGLNSSNPAGQDSVSTSRGFGEPFAGGALAAVRVLLPRPQRLGELSHCGIAIRDRPGHRLHTDDFEIGINVLRGATLVVTGPGPRSGPGRG